MERNARDMRKVKVINEWCNVNTFKVMSDKTLKDYIENNMHYVLKTVDQYIVK